MTFLVRWRLRLRLQTLRRDIGRWPTLDEYRTLAADEPTLPSAQEVLLTYGSWRRASEDVLDPRVPEGWDLDAIYRDYLAGTTQTELARRLGVSAETVRVAFLRAGLPKRSMREVNAANSERSALKARQLADRCAPRWWPRTGRPVWRRKQPSPPASGTAWRNGCFGRKASSIQEELTIAIMKTPGYRAGKHEFLPRPLQHRLLVQSERGRYSICTLCRREYGAINFRSVLDVSDRAHTFQTIAARGRRHTVDHNLGCPGGLAPPNPQALHGARTRCSAHHKRAQRQP